MKVKKELQDGASSASLSNGIGQNKTVAHNAATGHGKGPKLTPAEKKTGRGHTAFSGLRRLLTRDIQVSTPHRVRALSAHRAALKATHEKLYRLVNTVASGNLTDVQKASAKVASALKPLTRREPKDSDLLERLCGACLREELPKLSEDQLESLEGGLVTLATGRPDRVMEQLDLSVKAERLQRRLAALNQQDAALGKSRLRGPELLDIRRLVREVLENASHLAPTADAIAGTRFTLQKLLDINASAIDGIHKEDVNKKDAASQLAAATPAAIATMQMTPLRRLNDAFNLIKAVNGGSLAPAELGLHRDVLARMTAIDHEITAKVIGRKNLFAPATMTARELTFTWKAIATQGQKYLPLALANAAADIQAEIVQRQKTVIPEAQAALRAALRAPHVNDPAQDLLRPAAKAYSAALLLSATGEAVSIEEVSRWIENGLDAELRRGPSGKKALLGMQKLLAEGEGRKLLEVLFRDSISKHPTQIESLVFTFEFLKTLSHALDQRFPATSALRLDREQAPNRLSDLSAQTRDAMTRYLHVEAAARTNKRSSPFIDLEPEIRAAKVDLARARREGVDGADLLRVQTLTVQMVLMLQVTADPEQLSRLRDLTNQLKSLPVLDQDAKATLQTLSSTLASL